MDEFELISRFFDRRTDADGVIVGIGDDGAVLSPNTSKQQVQVIDTLVEGVHFPQQTDPVDIAYRAVAVNLSDIAAMGAAPRWMTLALTLNNADERWLQSFAGGLFEIADEFGVALVGGDTTRGPVTTATIAITGEIASGTALLRDGAKAGDSIYVTGTVGDAAAGLVLLQGGDRESYLSRRFLRPTPRVEVGRALVGVASAAIDLSDGLARDLNKLLRASGVGGNIDVSDLPISTALQAHAGPDEQLRLALSGGDDYELCFTANASHTDTIRALDAKAKISKIGTVTETAGLITRRNGDIVEIDASGYRHF